MLLGAALASGCSVGHGSGELDGTVSIEGCRAEGPYRLRPTAFFADATERFLSLRIQRGSDQVVRSDGLMLLVEDAAELKRRFLGQVIEVGRAAAPAIDISLYLNESCPAERDKTPVALSAVSGTIVFSSIYAPRVSKSEVRIAAQLTDVLFVDPRNDKRWARLNGVFDFLYTRGSPAQLFP
ncbi:MAG: hypothetical protein ABW252_18730 [Polyangiales bacterium]